MIGGVTLAIQWEQLGITKSINHSNIVLFVAWFIPMIAGFISFIRRFEDLNLHLLWVEGTSSHPQLMIVSSAVLDSSCKMKGNKHYPATQLKCACLKMIVNEVWETGAQPIILGTLFSDRPTCFLNCAQVCQCRSLVNLLRIDPLIPTVWLSFWTQWKSGWWLGHPSEKYEFVSWDD